MIRDLKAFYVAIVDNEVVCYSTNLLDFVAKLKKMESKVKSYGYYSRAFKQNKILTMAENKRMIILQKVV